MRVRTLPARSLTCLTALLIIGCADAPDRPGFRIPSGPAMSMTQGSTIAGTGAIVFRTVNPANNDSLISSPQSFSYSRTVDSTGWALMPEVSANADADSSVLRLPRVVASLPSVNTIGSESSDSVQTFTDSSGATVKLVFSQQQFESPYYPCYDQACPIAQIKEYRNDTLVTFHRMRWKWSTTGNGYVLYRSEITTYDSLTGVPLGKAVATLTPSTFTSSIDDLHLNGRGLNRGQAVAALVERTFNTVSTQLGEVLLPRKAYAQMGMNCAIATIVAVQAYKKFRCKLTEWRESGGDPDKYDEMREAAGDAAVAAGGVILACLADASGGS